MDETVVANEFAAVVVEVVAQGHGQRLRLRDLDSGACVTLDALDLRTFCLADEDEQQAWLRIGEYREATE
ncbi:MAG: hypothetical protein JWO98_3154 [Frankiales bacterium]|nr:hypothetical protein [Frankiales bacterium]